MRGRLQPSKSSSLLARVASGFGSMSVGMAFQAGFGFVSLMIAVRYIPKSLIGDAVIIQSLSAMFEVLSALCLHDISITKLIASETDQLEKDEIARTAVGSQVLLAVTVVLLIAATRPLSVGLMNSETLGRYFVYLPLMYVGENSYNRLAAVLQGYNRFARIAFSQILNAALKLVLTVLLVATLRLGMSGWLLSFVLGYGVAVCAQIAMLPMRPRVSFSLRHFRLLFAFGRNLGLNNLLSFAFRRTDRLLVGGMVSSAAVAAYSAANRLPTTVHKLYDAFRKVYFPVYAELHGRHAHSQKERLTSVTVSVLSFGVVLVSLIVVLFRTEIVLLVFTEEYLDSATALGLLMLPLSVGLIQNVYSATLIAADYPAEPFKINVIGMSVNLGANLLLIPIFGFYGAVYARIVAVFVAHPAYVFFLRLHRLKGHYLQHGIPLLIAGVCTGVYYALQVQGIGTRIALIAVFVALWAAINWSSLRRAVARFRTLC